MNITQSTALFNFLRTLEMDRELKRRRDQWFTLSMDVMIGEHETFYVEALNLKAKA